MDNTILLIDGSSFMFRAFYAIRNLSAPNGMPTNAIYGIVNMLKQMQKKYTTPHWVCVFDAPGKTFRDEIYPEYKATRRATPVELSQQIPYIHQLIQDLGIPLIMEPGVEADDVIATIATYYAKLDYKIIIATSDKDFAQIVNQNITLINTMTNEILDEAGVVSKFGVEPKQIIDYLALIGDNVDNIPGITKCGPKTAQKWLNDFGSIAGLIANQEQLSGVVGANFRAQQEWLATAQRLITIDCDVEVKSLAINQLDNLKCQPQNLQRLVSLYRELNFRTWLREAEAALQATPSLIEEDPLLAASTPLIHHHHLTDDQAISQLIEQLLMTPQATAFHLLYEDYTNPRSGIHSITIVNANQVYYIPLAGAPQQELELDFNQTAASAERIATIQRYLSSANPKISYHIKNIMHSLALHNIELGGICGDLALASYVKNAAQPHSLAHILSQTCPGIIINDEASLLGKGSKRQMMSSLSSAQAAKLACHLCEHILTSHQVLCQQLSAEELKIYQEMELPLAQVLFAIEQAGMKIDKARLRELAIDLRGQIQRLESEIFAQSGQVFNINSPKQLQDVLFNHLKLPTANVKKNASGYSTDEETLTNLASFGYTIANLLLEYRYLNKLMNTYIEKLPSYCDNNDLIHTSLEQTVVSSGRLSSKDPNLQNIPVKSQYGQAIRECFIAKKSHQLVCADYSQIELRVLAHISGDTNLIAAFKAGADIHYATASQIFNKPQDQISKDERRYAKTINFGLIYGKSVFGLAKELKIERQAAKTYIDNYFANYPQVKAYMENIKQQAHDNGYVSTIFGRRIYLANINASNNILRQAEERLALNAPMQGSAADIIKLAMLNVNRWLTSQRLTTQMVLQVHDELIFQVPDAEVELVLANLARLMTENFALAVPLEVEVKAAENWGAAH